MKAARKNTCAACDTLHQHAHELTELIFGIQRAQEAVWDATSEADRTVLRSKLAGAIGGAWGRARLLAADREAL